MTKQLREDVPFLRLVTEGFDPFTMLGEKRGKGAALVDRPVLPAEPRYAWLAPRPFRELPRTRTLVLCLTLQEAGALLEAWYPMEGTEYQEREEVRITTILGTRFYRELINHGYLRVSMNTLGIRMVRLDVERFGVTYPFIEPTTTKRTRLRTIHRTDAVWRPANDDTWSEMLRRAHDDAHLGLPRARGMWEQVRHERRVQCKEVRLKRRIEAGKVRKDFLLPSPIPPRFMLSINLEHAMVLTVLLEQQKDHRQIVVKYRELKKMLGPLLTHGLREEGAVQPLPADAVGKNRDLYVLVPEFFEQCRFEIAERIGEEEGVYRVRFLDQHMRWLYFEAHFRLLRAIEDGAA